jgi:hypothetical protein
VSIELESFWVVVQIYAVVWGLYIAASSGLLDVYVIFAAVFSENERAHSQAVDYRCPSAEGTVFQGPEPQ